MRTALQNFCASQILSTVSFHFHFLFYGVHLFDSDARPATLLIYPVVGATVVSCLLLKANRMRNFIKLSADEQAAVSAADASVFDSYVFLLDAANLLVYSVFSLCFIQKTSLHYLVLLFLQVLSIVSMRWMWAVSSVPQVCCFFASYGCFFVYTLLSLMSFVNVNHFTKYIDAFYLLTNVMKVALMFAPRKSKVWSIG